MIEALFGVMLGLCLYLMGIFTAKYILIDSKGVSIIKSPSEDTIIEDDEDEDNQFFK